MKQRTFFRLMLVMFALYGLNISSAYGQTYHWTAKIGTSTMIGAFEIYIDGDKKTTDNWELGAFVVGTDECRGTELVDVDDHVVYLSISGGTGRDGIPYPDEIYFKVYDNNTGREYTPDIPNVIYEVNRDLTPDLEEPIITAVTTSEITINTQPAATTTVTYGSIAGSLTVAASAEDNNSQSVTTTCRWYDNTGASSAGGSPITGADGSSFTIPTGLTAAGSPYYYYCVVSALNAEDVPSAVATVTVNKATPTAPAAPTLASRTATSVTLNTIAGAEYSKDGATWQTGETFTGLTPNTGYTFYAKLPEDANHNASPSSSASATITTGKAALGGTAAITGSAVFGATLTADVSGLSSTPSVALSALTYRWKRNGSVEIGAASTYTLAQEDVGQTVTVTVTAANCTGSVTSAPTATIAKATPTAPAAPAEASKTETGVTLTAITGAEYSTDDDAWQDSPTFGSLSPATAYTFYARLKETATHNASPASSANITTAPAVITVNVHPATSTEVTAGSVSGSLSVTASVTGGATLSYQWFSNTTASNSGGTLISGETAAMFTIPTTLTAGAYYYYCEVSATGGATTVPSTVATVTVNATYTATVSPTNKTFTAATAGYGVQAAQVFTITNTGSGTLTNVNASLGGSPAFEISTALSATTVPTGGTAIVSVNPKTGLAVGTHTGTLTITGDNSLNVTASLSFTVNTAFIPVTGITGIPTTATAGTALELAGTVAPTNATNKTIEWSVKDAGTTGAVMETTTEYKYHDGVSVYETIYKLETTAAGTVVVTATIANGQAVGTPYTKDFTINVSGPPFVPVTNITDVPTTITAGQQLTFRGTIAPTNATNKFIHWEIKSSGTTGATITTDGSYFGGVFTSTCTLSATAAGTLTITATVENGLTASTDYTQDFTITVTSAAGGPQSIALAAGVNWISVNVQNTDPTLLNQVKTSLTTVGQQLMGNGKSLQKLGALWIGNLTAISEKEMYQVKVSANHTLLLDGTPVDPQTEIPLAANGWSWIGYTPAVAMSVETALAGVNARAGDQVKSQSGFAEYTDAGWKGSLKDMQPGAGYMYLSNASTAGTFTYPGAPAPLPMERKNAGPTVEPRWTADRHRFADNMTVVAIVPDGETEAHGDLLEIAAFSGGECRGSALLQYVEGQDNPYMGFLLISGEAGDRLDFKVYDHGTGKEYNASGPVNTFTVNGIYGHVPNPAAITIRSATGIDPIGGALRIYPNPVTDVLYLECGQGEKYFAPTVEIFDVNGTAHIRRVDFAEPSLRVSHLAPGMYILRITVDGKTSVHKFIKQ